MTNEDQRSTLLARLQTAIELEWSTIPPYMVALLSMKLTANREAANLIRGVMMEEMLHMALVANVLNAVGGTVHIGPDNVPSYPRRLFKDRDVTMNLAPFSAENIVTFMQIEEPQTSVGGQSYARKRAASMRPSRTRNASRRRSPQTGFDCSTSASASSSVPALRGLARWSLKVSE